MTFLALLMIQVKVLIGDLDESHLRSPEVTNSSLLLTHDQKRSGKVDMVSFQFCLPRQDAWTDIQQDVTGSSRDLDLRSYVELTFQGHHTYIPARLDERNTTAS